MHTRPKFRNFGAGLYGNNPQLEQGSISTTLNGDTVLPLHGGYRLEHIKGKFHVTNDCATAALTRDLSHLPIKMLWLTAVL